MVTLNFYGNKYSGFCKSLFSSFHIAIYVYSRRYRGENLFFNVQGLSEKVTLIWTVLLVSFLSLEIFGNPEIIKVKLNPLHLRVA